MGFIGISEGAIPFAIADPKRVISANVIGSAVAGGLAGLLAVTNQAGHGGYNCCNSWCCWFNKTRNWSWNCLFLFVSYCRKFYYRTNLWTLKGS